MSTNIPDFLKDEISNLIINFYPYDRPTADQIWDRLEIPQEVDGQAVHTYIENDLQTRSFESDEKLTTLEIVHIACLLDMERLRLQTLLKNKDLDFLHEGAQKELALMQGIEGKLYRLHELQYRMESLEK